MGRDLSMIAITVLVVAWIAYDVRARKPISTTEWRERMRRLGIGTKKAA